MADYIPQSDADLSIWLNNYSKTLPTYAAALGLSDDDVVNAQKWCKLIIDAIAASTAAQAAARQAVADKETSITTNVPLLREGIQLGKKGKGYTEAIGKALGIVAPGDTPDFDAYKTVLNAQVFPGHVTVKFTKKGVQGVNIYGRLKGENNWTKLAYDTFSPYVDNRPLGTSGVPETRENMGIGVVHDAEVGQMSDIVQVVFGG